LEKIVPITGSEICDYQNKYTEWRETEHWCRQWTTMHFPAVRVLC
jgi:hypothetical protein